MHRFERHDSQDQHVQRAANHVRLRLRHRAPHFPGRSPPDYREKRTALLSKNMGSAMLDRAYANGEKTGYIANLGHGITQWVNPDNAKVFVDAVHDYKI